MINSLLGIHARLTFTRISLFVLKDGVCHTTNPLISMFIFRMEGSLDLKEK